jgi:hypothetical protein
MTSVLAGAELARWVMASCARQGVPVKVTDAQVVARVAVLLSGQALRRTAGAEGAAGLRSPAASQPPHRLDPGRVQTPSTRDTGTDDSVVEHRSDDGVTSIESQLGPLAS